jgi:hypothetical protein
MEEDNRVKNIREFIRKYTPEMFDLSEDEKKQFMLALWNRFNINQGFFQLFKRCGSNASLSIFVMNKPRGGDYLFGVKNPSECAGLIYSITYDISSEDVDTADASFTNTNSLLKALGCALMGDKFLDVCESW